MKKRGQMITAIVLVTVLVLVMFGCSAAEPNRPEDGKYDILFGASSTAGMAYQWVTAFCTVINDHSDILQASAITTLGSSENINLLACNEIDAGISTNIVASSAANGQVDWEGKPVEGLRIINYMYSDYCYVCVPANATYNTLSDLKGKRVNIGEKGGGIYTGIRQVLQALNLSDDYFDPYYLSVPDAVSAVQDGSLDALFIYGSAMNSSIQELQASRAGLKVIGLTQEEIDSICANNPMFRPTVMEESYTGIPPINTVGGAMCFMCTTQLPDEVSYELCRILNEYHDELVEITRWAETSTLEATADIGTELLPLADGTTAYLQDCGL